MLLYRCPDLEKLTIGPAAFVPWECRRRFDVFPFLGKSWPKLRVLNLEHAEFNALSVSSVELTVPHLREMIDSFLVNLPNLQELMGMPILFDIQIEASLPLTLVSAWFIRCLSNYHFTSLQGLDLSLRADFLSSWSSSRIPSGSFTALDTLTMRFEISHLDEALSEPLPDDHTEAVRDALRVCPRLLHLRIMCETDSASTFYWVSATHTLGHPLR